MNISFSGTLLRFVNFQKNVNVDASSINDALRKLVSIYPQAQPVIYDAEGQVRQVHHVFVNGKQVRSVDFDTSLAPSDQIDILTAIAGG